MFVLLHFLESNACDKQNLMKIVFALAYVLLAFIHVMAEEAPEAYDPFNGNGQTCIPNIPVDYPYGEEAVYEKCQEMCNYLRARGEIAFCAEQCTFQCRSCRHEGTKQCRTQIKTKDCKQDFEIIVNCPAKSEGIHSSTGFWSRVLQ
jgi:hypothetical protein